MTSETLTQAVNLAICLERGYYLGTVARDKQKDLESLKAIMSNEDLAEFYKRVK